MQPTKKLFVFDLDFTLWDAGGLWCDCTTPPYRKKNDMIIDSKERIIRLYPDVREILDTLIQKGKIIAIASRTEQPEWAKELLDLFGIRQLFHYEQIFPGSKIYHLKRIQEQSGISYKQMIFFDDEHRNIVDVSTLGVQCVKVFEGINLNLVHSFF